MGDEVREDDIIIAIVREQGWSDNNAHNDSSSYASDVRARIARLSDCTSRRRSACNDEDAQYSTIAQLLAWLCVIARTLAHCDSPHLVSSIAAWFLPRSRRLRISMPHYSFIPLLYVCPYTINRDKMDSRIIQLNCLHRKRSNIVLVRVWPMMSRS